MSNAGQTNTRRKFQNWLESRIKVINPGGQTYCQLPTSSQLSKTKSLENSKLVNFCERKEMEEKNILYILSYDLCLCSDFENFCCIYLLEFWKKCLMLCTQCENCFFFQVKRVISQIFLYNLTFFNYASGFAYGYGSQFFSFLSAELFLCFWNAYEMNQWGVL